jgi:hypothetical protein
MYRYVFLVAVLLVLTLSLFGFSRIWQSGQKYEIDKTSPNGTYRVKIELREEKAKGTRDNTERLKILYLRRQDVVFSHEWENSDQYEPSLRDGIEVVEWISNNVLRIGRDRSDQPFSDELIVSNATDQNLKYVEVDYGKYESFHIFDLAAKTQVTLQASPEFKPDHSSNYFLGYGGKTENGTEFHGNMEEKQRKSPADGPLKFQIAIKTRDLR